MAGITKVKLIQLKAPNRVGLGADVLNAIAGSKANIVALNAWEEGKQGAFLVDTSNNQKAKLALRKAKFAVTELPAFKVQVANRAGQFAELLGRVADAKINVGGVFSVASGKTATVYVRTAADARAIKAMSTKPKPEAPKKTASAKPKTAPKTKSPAKKKAAGKASTAAKKTAKKK